MQIANTVKEIDAGVNPLLKQIMDRSQPLKHDLVSAVLSLPQFSWHGRRPTPAVTKTGAKRPTNLDTLSWLIELYRRKATIELAQYDNRTPWTARAAEQHVGGTRRHGKIVGLVSHRQHLSFSVQMADMSIVTSHRGILSSGAMRSYMLADYDGSQYEGWYGFDWDKTDSELAFLKRRKLLVDGKVNFGDYLHMNRRQSIYSESYLLLKLLWQRIEDEISFYQGECKRLEEAGVKPTLNTDQPLNLIVAKGPSRSVQVPVFEMKVGGLEFAGSYTPVTDDVAGYEKARLIVQYLSDTVRPIVQFMVRADEVAFYRFGLKQGFVSSWIKGTKWVYDPRSRWHSMMLGDRLSIAYKSGETEKRIAA